MSNPPTSLPEGERHGEPDEAPIRAQDHSTLDESQEAQPAGEHPARKRGRDDCDAATRLELSIADERLREQVMRALRGDVSDVTPTFIVRASRLGRATLACAKVLSAVAVIFAFLLAGVAFVQVLGDGSVYIADFSVAPQAKEAGWDSHSIRQALYQRVTMVRNGRSPRPIHQFSESSDGLLLPAGDARFPDVELPSTGISLASARDLIAALIGDDRRISGALLAVDGGFRVQLRSPIPEVEVEVTPVSSTVEEAVSEAGDLLARRLDPYWHALRLVYMDPWRCEEFLVSYVEEHDVGERPWVFVIRGLIARNKARGTDSRDANSTAFKHFSDAWDLVVRDIGTAGRGQRAVFIDPLLQRALVGDPREAIRDLTLALEYVPNDRAHRDARAVLLRKLGLSYSAAGDEQTQHGHLCDASLEYEAAIASLSDAVRLQPMFARAWNSLAETYMRRAHQGSPPLEGPERTRLVREAIHAHERAIHAFRFGLWDYRDRAEQPRLHARALNGRGEALMLLASQAWTAESPEVVSSALGDFHGAIEVIQAWESEFGNAPQCRVEAARAYLEIGNCERLTASEAASTEVRAERMREAVMAYRRCIASDPDGRKGKSGVIAHAALAASRR